VRAEALFFSSADRLVRGLSGRAMSRAAEGVFETEEAGPLAASPTVLREVMGLL
jgi:hypothetical protein